MDDQPWVRYPNPTFEGFGIEMVSRGQLRRLRAVVAQELGKGWRVRRFGDEPTTYEVTGAQAELSAAEAWQLAYRLRAQPGVAYAEPIFEVAVSNRADWNEPGAEEGAEAAAEDGLVPRAAATSAACFETTAVPESADPEWSLKLIRAPEAWARFFPSVALPGASVVIGHPDTGYRRHPEIASSLLTSSGFDYVDNDQDAEDRLEGGFLRNPGHGTGTASVIVSPRGAQPGVVGAQGTSGVAPGARVIPFRVSRSVVLLSTLSLAQAIEQAAREGAHVISISMGGVASWRLRQAIVFAQRRGVIVLAAAGNCVGFVAWPAAYDEVIAVAACNARRQIWPGSSRGRAVDVTAPGESVWRASFAPDTAAFISEPGTGTSYAVATAAGIAALWLARHGRDTLIRTYGAEKIPFIFNQILRDTCTPVSDPTWTPGQFGAGLVNAEAALAAPLPDTVARVAPAPALYLEEHVPVDAGRDVTFAHLFEGALGAAPAAEGAAEALGPTDALEATLAELLQTDPAGLPGRLREVGQELAFHLAVTPRLHRRLAAAIAGRRAGARGEPGAEAARPEADVADVRAGLAAGGVSTALRTAMGEA